MKDKIPVLVTYSYTIEDGYMRIAQPTTGTELLLTKEPRAVFEYLLQNKGLTCAEVITHFERGNDAMAADRIVNIVYMLLDYNLIELKDAGGW